MRVIDACDAAVGSDGGSWASGFVVAFVVFLFVDLFFSSFALFKVVRAEEVKAI